MSYQPRQPGRSASYPAGPGIVHDRLWQLARQKRLTASAVATDILDENSPRFKIEREG